MSGAERVPSKKSHRDAILTAAKWMLAVVVIVYACERGLVRTADLVPYLVDPLCIGVGLLGQLLIYLTHTARWKVIHDRLGGRLSFRELFDIGMISHFLSTFAGGSLGNDVIRGLYAARWEGVAKVRSLWSILFDRGAGLITMASFSYMGLVLKFAKLPPDHVLGQFASGASTFLPLFILFLAIGFVAGLKYFQRIFFFSAAFSFLSTFSTITWVYCVGALIGVPLTFADYLFIVPIASIVSAIPVLPLGIGVGQIAYFQLFQILGVSGQSGVLVCTVLQSHILLFNLLGAPYYLCKKNVSAQQPENS